MDVDKKVPDQTLTIPPLRRMSEVKNMKVTMKSSFKVILLTCQCNITLTHLSCSPTSMTQQINFQTVKLSKRVMKCHHFVMCEN